MYIHKLSLTEINEMIPWDRDLYVDRLGQYIEKQELERNQEEVSRQSRMRR